jgi:hypothetical protein
MTGRWTGWLAWSAWLVTLGLVPISVALDLAARTSTSILLFHGFGSAFALCGAVVVSRRRVPIGWLLLAIGVSGSVASSTVAYKRFLEATATASGAFGPVSNVAWALMVVLLALLLQLFPTGGPLSARWRPLAWLTAVWVLLVFPIGLTTVAGALAETLFFSALLILIVASGTSVMLRFFRSRGEARQQLKWFAYATGVLVLVVVLSASGVGRGWIGFVGNVTSYGLPLAIGVALLRYRLYDIDLLINRTLVYGALSAALLATYVLSVLALSALLRPLTGNSELAVAGSTLAVVAAFGPLRARIQRAVDRRFYRSRYDAARTLDAFAARLRDEVDLDTLSRELIGVARETVQPAHAGLWLRPSRSASLTSLSSPDRVSKLPHPAASGRSDAPGVARPHP